MIRYALNCDHGHAFEAWFSGSADFDTQVSRGLVSCAVCGSTDVHKALMAPSVKRTDKGRGAVAAAPAPGDAATRPVAVSAVAGLSEEVRSAVRKLREAVARNSDYVGKGFAEEARKIHYGEAPARNIHGEATGEESRALAEEGIEVCPLPPLPEDHN